MSSLFCLLCAVVISVPIAAAPAPKATGPAPPVFITSNPIDAVVVIDGKTVYSRTPMLLRNLQNGKHRIMIAHQGYAPYSGTLVVGGTKPVVFHAALESSSFVPVFGSHEKVVIDGTRANNSQERYRLPTGQYQFDSSGGTLTINPVFPAQQILNVVDLTTGGLAVASLILLGDAILNSSSANSSNGNNGGSIAVWSLTGVSALSDVLLHIQKARFMRENAPVPIMRSAIDTEQTYNKAQELLASGSLASAVELYIQIIRTSPDSAYYPRALYQLAKIHAIEGDNLLARSELSIILDKYPMPDLYDKTCKSLADISYREQDYRQAIAYLDKMVFLDPLFPRAQIEQYRTSIEKKLSQKGAGS